MWSLDPREDLKYIRKFVKTDELDKAIITNEDM